MNKLQKHEPTLVKMKVSADQKKEAVRHCLNGVCADYSIPIPDKRIMDRLIDFVIESYPTMRISEITKAFDMNASGNYWQASKKMWTLDKISVGFVISNYLLWRREKYRQQSTGSYGSKKLWTPKDSYNSVMDYKAKHGHLPEYLGGYLWAYKYACENGIMKFDKQEWSEAMKWARANIDQVRNPSKGKEVIMAVIQKELDEDIKHLAAKQLFTKYYTK
jgi:hypothetical protein